MQKISLLNKCIILFIFSLAIHCETMNFIQSQLYEPETVPYIDLTRYSGTWYEQAVIPYFAQIGCSKTKATYSPLPDGSVKVENQCVRFGKKSRITGKAVPLDETNSKLQVSFSAPFDFGAPYWIVRIGQDYEYAVISNPGYRNLWILTRAKSISECLYNDIIKDLSEDGYPVNKLVRVQQ